MKSRYTALICLLLASLLTLAVWGTSGDRWAILTEAGADVWRITSGGHLLPGSDSTYDVGSSSARAQSVYGVDLVVDRQKNPPVTVTTNTTLTSNPAQVYIGSISGNRTYVLATPAVGQIVWFTDTAGNVSVNGNVTIDGAGSNTINGVANVTFQAQYGSIRLEGVSTSAWVAQQIYAP